MWYPVASQIHLGILRKQVRTKEIGPVRNIFPKLRYSQILRTSFRTVPAQKKRTAGDYVEVFIGVLTALVLLLLGVFLIIVVLNHRHKLENSPTAILKNPFGVRSLKSKVSWKNALCDELLWSMLCANSRIILFPSGCVQEYIADSEYHR